MRTRTRPTTALLLLALGLALGCGGGKESAPAPDTSGLPADLPRGLLVALSQFEVGPDGKVLPKPGPALLEMVVRRGGAWDVVSVEDPDSNVFHKAMVYAPPGHEPGILTLGGSAALLRLRHPDGKVETLWQKDFGGKFSRMRDAEIADIFGDGVPSVAVATHDQGVVATVHPRPDGSWDVQEIDHQPDTFVHEIEIGDLDGDGTLEVYSTVSEPNRLDGTPQPGKVTRYVPARGEGRVVVADLGSRHAKEILVGDVDGDGRDELYVSVEGETEGRGADARLVAPEEIRRFDADTPPTGGHVIATLHGERLCRVLTAGDLDGDGKKEMVAAAFKTGLWLLRPGPDPRGLWMVTPIDKDSSGFEHAALLTDLDGDGIDELYVASDDQGELRRYTWNGSGFDKQVILRRKVPGAFFTWNLMPVPADMVPAK